MTKPKRRAGGQPGNVNSLRHGAYSRRFTPDSPAGRLVHWIESTLMSAIPDPSPQETLILKRVSMKAHRCDAIERELLRCNGDVPESLEKSYLRWSHSMREDLKLLGLERRTKPVQELQAYVQSQSEGGTHE